MSPLIIICMVAFITVVFSQFGNRLAAKNSVAWWCILIFLTFTAASPESLEPIAHFLGIKLVSNLVLSAMIVFLIFQAIQESAFSTRNARTTRALISNIAVKDYLQKQKFGAPDVRMRVLVICPCLNEEETLPDLISRLKLLRHPRFDFYFCVVNDGSKDTSEQILARELPQGYTSHLVNIGVSGALLTGFRIVEESGMDFAVQCDSDGQHPIEAIPELLDQAILKGSDLMIGSRFAASKQQITHESTTKLRRLGSIIVLFALQLFSRKSSVSDPTSGFRVYSRKACLYLIQNMPDEYPEPESVALLSLAGAKISEAPVNMRPRTTGVSSLAGIQGAKYMTKVITGLVGLRLRSVAQKNRDLFQ